MHETHYHSDPAPPVSAGDEAQAAPPAPSPSPSHTPEPVSTPAPEPMAFPGTEAIQDVTASEADPAPAAAPRTDRPARRAARAAASVTGAAGLLRRLPWDLRLKIAVVLSFVILVSVLIVNRGRGKAKDEGALPLAKIPPASSPGAKGKPVEPEPKPDPAVMPEIAVESPPSPPSADPIPAPEVRKTSSLLAMNGPDPEPPMIPGASEEVPGPVPEPPATPPPSPTLPLMPPADEAPPPTLLPPGPKAEPTADAPPIPQDDAPPMPSGDAPPILPDRVPPTPQGDASTMPTPSPSPSASSAPAPPAEAFPQSSPTPAAEAPVSLPPVNSAPPAEAAPPPVAPAPAAEVPMEPAPTPAPTPSPASASPVLDLRPAPPAPDDAPSGSFTIPKAHTKKPGAAPGPPATTETQVASAPAIEAATPARAASEPIDPMVHTVRRGENFWTIARYHYGSGRFYMALWNANKDKAREPQDLYVGTVIRIPAVEDLDRSLITPPQPVQAEAKAASVATGPSSRRDPGTRRTSREASDRVIMLPVGEDEEERRKAAEPVNLAPRARSLEPSYRWHEVRRFETPRSIARVELGDSERAEEIVRLNPEEAPDGVLRLRPGMKIKVPDDPTRRE